MDSQASAPGPSRRSDASKIKRTRKGVPKSKNGCTKCKARRIRCDERQPSCDNCHKFGCPCPGYQKEIRWSNKYQPSPTAAGLTRADQRDTQPQAASLQHVSVTSQHDIIDLENVFDQAWPTESLSLSHTTPSHNPIFTAGELFWGHSIDLETFELSSVPLDPVTVPDYRIIQNPLHIPTTLIEYLK